MHAVLSSPAGVASSGGLAPTSGRLPLQHVVAHKRQQHHLKWSAAPETGGAQLAGGGRRRRWLPAVAHAAAAEEAQQGGEPAAEALQQSEDEPEEWVEVGRIGPPHGVRGEMKVQPLTDFPEERLGTPGTRWLQAPAPKIGRRHAEPPYEVELEWGRSMISKGNEVWLVKIEDVDSPEEAALLRGHTLLIPASAREPLQDEDEFYVQDLVGLRVFLQSSGEEVGHVADVFDGTGTHDVLRIQLAAAQLARLSASSSSSSEVEEEEEEEEEEGELEEEGEQGRQQAAAPRGGGSGEAARHVLLPFAKALVPVVDLKAGRMEITPPAGLLELAAPSNLRRPRREHRGRRERRRTRPKGRAAAEAGGRSSNSMALTDNGGATA